MANFYIWHGAGQCDNSTNDSLDDAKSIMKSLIDDGHDDVYITNEDDEVVFAADVSSWRVRVAHSSKGGDAQAIKTRLQAACQDAIENELKLLQEELILSQCSEQPTRLVLEVEGGLFNVMSATDPVDILILDGDTEGGDEENIKEINGAEFYTSRASADVDKAYVNSSFKQSDQ